ncbi:MAG: hypothetical protein AAFY56_18340 [Pseudomonadota bacterium]
MVDRLPGLSKVGDVTLKRGTVDGVQSQDRFANAETGYLLDEKQGAGNGSLPAFTPEFTDHKTNDPGVTAVAAEFVIFRIGQKTADAVTEDRFDFGAGLDRMLFEPNTPSGEDDALLVDNLVRRSLRVSDPNDPAQGETGASPSHPFGHELGIPHEHQPPSEAALTRGPKLIILDEPASEGAVGVDAIWL